VAGLIVQFVEERTMMIFSFSLLHWFILCMVVAVVVGLPILVAMLIATRVRPGEQTPVITAEIVIRRPIVLPKMPQNGPFPIASITIVCGA
jgi:hypothetical protein